MLNLDFQALASEMTVEAVGGSVDTTVGSSETIRDSRVLHNEHVEYLEREIKRLGDMVAASLPVHLESLATISISIHEPKAPVRALGHRAPKGFSRSVRTIAGTMILLVVEDHPLRKLMYQADRSKFGPNDSSWSLDSQFGQGSYRHPGTIETIGGSTRLSTLLKPFNLTLSYRTEVLPAKTATFSQVDTEALMDDFEGAYPLGTIRQNSSLRREDDPRAMGIAEDQVARAKQNRNNARGARKAFRQDPYAAVNSIQFRTPKIATIMLEGIEIVSEGITTSVNDMVTEIVIQFQAQDMKQLSTLHESALTSFTPEELPRDIYAELRGQAKLSSENERATIIGEQKQHANALRSELREARRIRRKAKNAGSNSDWGASDLPGNWDPLV
jgi:hypothetical protein